MKSDAARARQIAKRVLEGQYDPLLACRELVDIKEERGTRSPLEEGRRRCTHHRRRACRPVVTHVGVRRASARGGLSRSTRAPFPGRAASSPLTCRGARHRPRLSCSRTT